MPYTPIPSTTASGSNSLQAKEEFWTKHLTEQTRDGWYKKAIKYWDKQEASVNGVLGGFGHTSAQDLRESKRLLQMLRGRADLDLKFGTVLDCGAGIGRISEGLLLEEFATVDLLEPCTKLFVDARRRHAGRIRHFFQRSLQDFAFTEGEIDRSRSSTTSSSSAAGPGGSGRPLGESGARGVVPFEDASASAGANLAKTAEVEAAAPLSSSAASLAPAQGGEQAGESHSSSTSTSTSTTAGAPPRPPPACTSASTAVAASTTPLAYDCIWNQWVLLYLTDDDLITYLRKCQAHLTKNGFLFVKENVLNPPSRLADANGKEWRQYNRGLDIDEDDNGVTRSDERYRELFEKAGMELVCAVKQVNWPKDLFPIYMYVLR